MVYAQMNIVSIKNSQCQLFHSKKSYVANWPVSNNSLTQVSIFVKSFTFYTLNYTGSYLYINLYTKFSQMFQRQDNFFLQFLPTVHLNMNPNRTHRYFHQGTAFENVLLFPFHNNSPHSTSLLFFQLQTQSNILFLVVYKSLLIIFPEMPI